MIFALDLQGILCALHLAYMSAYRKTSRVIDAGRQGGIIVAEIARYSGDLGRVADNDPEACLRLQILWVTSCLNRPLTLRISGRTAARSEHAYFAGEFDAIVIYGAHNSRKIRGREQLFLILELMVL